jgi:Protein of unknown function (DUF2752)
MKRNKLYKLIILACFLGYSWLFFANYIAVKSSKVDFTVCLVKRITSYPCPSCGTTRAISHFFEGNIITSLWLNPFGIIVSLIMIFCPIWIVIDLYTKKDSFYQFYSKIETFLKTKKVYIPLLILVILNWIWNINKQL